ncbi:class I SAM-dependent methyltransferase [Opitutales bacterium]|nr:class I SAM-dependent methyltransferase [Opitutales bacterium]
MKAFTLLFCISIFMAMLCAFYSIKQSSPYYIQIVGKSDTNTSSQLFFDIGNSYIEKDSVKQGIRKKEIYEKFIMPLPIKKIYGLRLDPLDRNGSLQIKSISVLGNEKDGNQYKILHEFDLKSLKAVQQVDLVMNDTGNVIATTHNDCNDPVIELPLKEPFDHWQMSDFLGVEWLKKSAFFSFLITPIALALSFSENKRRDITGKVSFKINKQNHSLEWGDTFTSKPENCYQDTKEENIRSIIEKIQNGTPWKQAVKQKFKTNNPWLYEIVCSPKRTKFIDEFVKPKDLHILDIGAGWGQFTLPLAKQNQICSLEPTPERLDFIKAAAEQEKVSPNISFIGADYLDINFQNKFDLILSIGVLEWVGAFKMNKPPEELQLDFLKKIKSELKENGKLIIGIENRLGLKYLLGAPDDHTGLSNISIHQKELARKLYREETDQELRVLTHSITEYQEMLHKAGFDDINFYTSNPDYKLPVKIFPIKNNQCKLNEHILKEKWIEEHDGTSGKKLANKEELRNMSKSFARLNTLHNFAPSYFIEIT